MSSSSPSTHSILQLPDEVLANIILHFNARERLALANTCIRFNTLVFGDKELLRNLDFSKKGRLTAPTDIQQYFKPKTACELVRRINIQNVKCMRAGRMLNESIGRAINLIDVNIHGTRFEVVEELASFLEPLVHLRRLSLDWPKSENEDFAVSRNLLQKPFRGLEYLSLAVRPHSGRFPPVVQLCEELEELCMVTLVEPHLSHRSTGLESTKLKNLRVVQFRGYESSAALKTHLMTIVPDPAEWTDFHLIHSGCGSYLEKNVEVCDELRDSKLLRPPLPSGFAYGKYNERMGWNLLSERLLNEAIKITHQDVPEEFCSLTFNGKMGAQPCLLKIDEAKRLLKDPGYQISYLHFNHPIEPDCDAHLVGSAFPNLTELVLNRIILRNSTVLPRERCSKRRLRKRDSPAPEDPDDPGNTDSSFEMLVENTPHVRRLTICAEYDTSYDWKLWDTKALSSIPRWERLTAICLKEIPIKDGSFLVDIGRQCLRLEEIHLFDLGQYGECCYGVELVLMLEHSRNLKTFSISNDAIDNMPAVFSTLSRHPKLETVRVKTETERFDAQEVISSVEQMLRRCSELTEFVFVVESESNRFDAELRPDLNRIVGELNRPNFVFLAPESLDIKADREDASTSFFPNVLHQILSKYFYTH